jgi:hypothetical protein
VEALSEVLRAVKLTGAVFLSAEFRAPWCIAAQREFGIPPARWRRDEGSPAATPSQ